MRSVRQVVMGLGIALVSIIITLGGLAITMAEGNMTAPTQAILPTNTPVIILVTNTPLPTATATPTAMLPTASIALSPSPTSCIPPDDWSSYIVQGNDTLDGLAKYYKVSPETLIQSNCLVAAALQPGQILFVPALPTPTPTPTLMKTSIACGRPRYWVAYTVMPGDTLYRLSRSYGITVQQLQQANCMGSKTLIRVGQILYVPPWAAFTPTPTIFVWPTDTWTEPSPTPEDTPTLTPTDTEIPSVVP
jgi:LysM repeat protein